MKEEGNRSDIQDFCLGWIREWPAGLFPQVSPTKKNTPVSGEYNLNT